MTQNRYNGCNILRVFDAGPQRHRAARRRLAARPPAAAGLARPTAGDVNDVADPVSPMPLAGSTSTGTPSPRTASTALKELCGQTGSRCPAIRLRGAAGGTVSQQHRRQPRLPPAPAIYLHAQAPST